MQKKLKILIVGKQNIFRWPENLADGFEEAGCQTQLFFINRRYSCLRLLRNISRKINHKYFEHQFNDALAEDLKHTVSAIRPDMIFFVSSFFIPLTLFKIWDELPASILKVGWAGDLFGQEMKERADQLDHLYCSDSSFVERAVQYGFKCTASLLPHAFNPRIFTSDAALPRRNELLFIGSYSFQRASICQQIQIPCRIIGPKWSRMPGSVHLIESRKIPLQKVAELYLGTRSVLNIQSFDNVINGLNMRTFEAAGCGAAVLNDYLTDLPELFEPEREILTYRSIDELNEYAQKLHNDETFTKTLAEAGRKRAEREHTYRHRAKQIVNDLF